MPAEWTSAPQHIIDLAKRIIREHHPKLADARIAFIMRSEAPTSSGKTTYGRAKKVSAELQVHIPFDFIIWLAKDEYAYLAQLQREALIDHELSHCHWDGLNASIRPHDVEEFGHIIERYGFWWPGAKEFEAAVQQALPIAHPREGTVGTVDFGGIMHKVADGLKAEGIDAEVIPATSREL